MSETPPGRPFPRPESGLLIAFEGIDGCGKSTQAKLACQDLESQGLSALLLREPTDGPVGQEIRRLSRTGRADPQREAGLFLEDRRQHVRERIAPALRDGFVVLLDRYYISTMAYQGARGLDPEAIREANERIAPRPHLILVFDIPVDIALQRIAARGGNPDLFETREYLLRVDAVFRGLQFKEARHVDAQRPVPVIADDVRRLVGQLAESRREHLRPKA